MIQFSKINWASAIFDPNGQALIAMVGLFLFIAALGIIEALMHRSMRIARSTWAFGALPAISGFVVIAFDSGFHPVVRICLLLVWCAFVGGVIWVTNLVSGKLLPRNFQRQEDRSD